MIKFQGRLIETTDIGSVVYAETTCPFCGAQVKEWGEEDCGGNVTNVTTVCTCGWSQSPCDGYLRLPEGAVSATTFCGCGNELSWGECPNCSH